MTFPSSWSDGNDPMWVFDQNTLAILAVNEVAIREYGYTRDEFLRLTILDIRPVEDIAEILNATLDPANRHDSKNELWRHQRKDGAVMDVSICSKSLEFQGRRAELVTVRILKVQVPQEGKLILDPAHSRPVP